MMGDRIVIAVAALISLLLQVLIAPHIAIGFAVPNFMAAFCLAAAVARQDATGPVLTFALGLIYDLISGGPVGGMAFSLTLCGALASSTFRRANNDTIFIAVAVLAGAAFLTELVYGVLFLMFGYAAGLGEALAFRVLPCFLYDFVVALVFYFALTRLLGRRTPSRSEIRQL